MYLHLSTPNPSYNPLPTHTHTHTHTHTIMVSLKIIAKLGIYITCYMIIVNYLGNITTGSSVLQQVLWPPKISKEGKVLFNDALNTFYIRLYGVTHIVKDHSDSEWGNMGYSFRLAARVFYMHHPTDRITHTTAFVTPVVEHWLEREITKDLE